MITLIQFPPAWGIPNPSPFCIKVEAYLRLAKIPYKNKYSLRTTINPKHKFPCIKYNNEVIGDSELIIDFLKEQFGDPLDGHLSKEQAALGLLIDRLFTDHLYWCALCFRWKHEPEWSAIKDTFFNKVPNLLRNFVSNKVRKKFVRYLYAQGAGRHSFTELSKMVDKDLQALSLILQDKTFFLGTSEPTSVDCTAYGFLENLYSVPFEHELKNLALKYDNLKVHCDKMRNLFSESHTN